MNQIKWLVMMYGNLTLSSTTHNDYAKVAFMALGLASLGFYLYHSSKNT